MIRKSPLTNRLEEIVTEIDFVDASPRSASRGLLGFVRFRIGGVFVVDSIALRRTRGGRLTLSFPTRKSTRGRPRNVFHPIDQLARDEIERVVLAAVREQAPWLFDSVEELSP